MLMVAHSIWAEVCCESESGILSSLIQDVQVFDCKLLVRPSELVVVPLSPISAGLFVRTVIELMKHLPTFASSFLTVA